MRADRSATLVDAGALLLLGVLALLGFRQTYAGWSYLLVGGAGLLAGVAVAAGLRALRQPVIVVAAALMVVFVLLGDVLVLPGRPPFAVDTMRDLSASAIYGWKQLLTTLPPVSSRDPLLVVPYILGLVGGGGGYLLARAIPERRARRVPTSGGRAAAPRRWLAGAGPLLRVVAPVIAPIGMLAAAIAFGTDVPGAELADGVAFTVVVLCWVAARGHRSRPLSAPGTRRMARLATSGALFAVASLGAVLLSPVLSGAESASRTVLRDRIVPPFDINEYPSPLVAFRKYTKAANNLYDQTLFTVTGLPAGATVRIASLDDYDGLVWGASNGVANDGFQRVGAVISPPSGPPVTVRVHITAAYAAQPDLSAWVPVSGTLVSLDVGPQASTLHVNRAAEDAIVTGRLRAGDTYTFTSEVTTPVMPADVQPYSVPALTEDAQSLLGGRIAAWTAGAAGRGAQLKAVADYLRNTGAYSDGGKDEGMYLPGHSLGRLSSFVNGPQPVGDDEQYAAVYALVANDLGIPARVVFGARLEADGSVRGKDVHAWVEVHVADGSWVPIPESTFMPDQSRHPDQQPPQDTQNVKAAVVPPPNAVHKPTSVTDSQTNETVHPPRPPGRPSLLARIWALLAPILTWAGPPLLLAALFAVAVLGRKWRRRRRRRTAGSTANRHAGGWREIVDLACDAGLAMPAGQTRQQQADRILAPGQPVRPGRHRNRSQRRASALTVRVDAGRALLPPYPPETADAIRYLADVADLAVYGPDDPDEQAVRAYWSHIDSARKTMLQRYGRRRRTLIRLNLASIRSRP